MTVPRQMLSASLLVSISCGQQRWAEDEPMWLQHLLLVWLRALQGLSELWFLPSLDPILKGIFMLFHVASVWSFAGEAGRVMCHVY